MTKSIYWKDLLKDRNNQLLNLEEIEEINKQINGENKNDLTSKSVLIVAQDKIVLEPSISQPEISEIELPLGTVLELVPEDKIPTNLAERGPWNNYVVYLEITNENGEIEKKYALIPEHYKVSSGYLSMTPENIIEVAFTCLGDSYESMNNINFITSVYKCFGLELPMDSELKNKLKDKIKDVSNMSLEEKKQKLKDLPVGSILQVREEYAIFLGTQNEKYYMISSMNGKINSVVLSKLEIKNLTSVIDFTLKAEKETITDTTTCEFIEGANQTYIIGEDGTARFRLSPDFSLFENGGAVYVDGEKIDAYTVESGSTIITLSKEFMSSLSEGEHTLKVAFNNGESAETKFIIAKASKVIEENPTSNKDTTPTATETKTITTKQSNPKTGDNITIWISLMVISMLGVSGVGAVKFVKENK